MWGSLVQASSHLEYDSTATPESPLLKPSGVQVGRRRAEVAGSPFGPHQEVRLLTVITGIFRDLRLPYRNPDWDLEKCQPTASQEKFNLMNSGKPGNDFLGHEPNNFQHENGGEEFCRGQWHLATGQWCQGVATFQTKSDCITDLSLMILQFRNWARRLLWWYSWFIWNKNVMLNINEFWASW